MVQGIKGLKSLNYTRKEISSPLPSPHLESIFFLRGARLSFLCRVTVLGPQPGHRGRLSSVGWALFLGLFRGCSYLFLSGKIHKPLYSVGNKLSVYLHQSSKSHGCWVMSRMSRRASLTGKGCHQQDKFRIWKEHTPDFSGFKNKC